MNSRPANWLALLPIFFASLPSNSLTAHGSVIDAQSRRGIGRAEIVVVGSSAKAPVYTVDDGTFVLPLEDHVGVGTTIRIRATKMGYEPQEKLVAASPDIPIVFELRRSPSPPRSQNRRLKDIERQPQSNVHVSDSAEVKVLRAIRKTDSFTTVVPINSAAPRLPVPLDENFDDPHHEYFSRLMELAGVPENAVEAKWPIVTLRKIASETERFNFVTRLIQFYVLQEIQELQRGNKGGIKLTIGEGATPISRKPILPPDTTSYSPKRLTELVAENEFFTPSARMVFEHVPFVVPDGTNISLSETGADPKEGKLFTCSVTLESPSRYKLEFLVQPSVASGPGMPPAKFQTQAAATVQSYAVVVTMNAEIARTKTDSFDPEEYVQWTTALFAGLQKLMGFD